ncbi:hypothetical protein BG61_34990 [Caballeronia glathei]|uniref:Uncharacterized protein n=1 Tax=Caballeronia glathei TaxID=60547 RepID=A0A069PET6_9BURK|nr:hypothetical protein BG61_34990 [Caballeronia glathei]
MISACGEKNSIKGMRQPLRKSLVLGQRLNRVMRPLGCAVGEAKGDNLEATEHSADDMKAMNRAIGTLYEARRQPP